MIRQTKSEAGVYSLAQMLEWLLTALAFAFVAYSAATNRTRWITLAAAVSVFSLLLSVTELPAARIGVWVNLAILSALVAGTRLEWL